MIIKDVVNKELIKLDNTILKNDFVSIAVQVDGDGNCYHSALLFGNEGDHYLFHFDSKSVLLESPIPNMDDWYFFKELEFINPLLTSLFLSHCRQIIASAKPFFGFLFDGSYYKDGKYFTESGISEITTCVGFCLKVLDGFRYGTDNYMEVDDWDETSLEIFKTQHTAFYEHMIAKIEAINPDKDYNYKKNYLKRITPIELTTSAFVKKRPVRKNDIDPIVSDVNDIIKNKRVYSI